MLGSSSQSTKYSIGQVAFDYYSKILKLRETIANAVDLCCSHRQHLRTYRTSG